MANAPKPSAKPVMFQMLYDFEICESLEELKACFAYMNTHHCCLRAVTQDAQGIYTVFFERLSHG